MGGLIHLHAVLRDVRGGHGPRGTDRSTNLTGIAGWNVEVDRLTPTRVPRVQVVAIQGVRVRPFEHGGGLELDHVAELVADVLELLGDVVLAPTVQFALRATGSTEVVDPLIVQRDLLVVARERALHRTNRSRRDSCRRRTRCPASGQVLGALEEVVAEVAATDRVDIAVAVAPTKDVGERRGRLSNTLNRTIDTY